LKEVYMLVRNAKIKYKSLILLSDNASA